jgi:hypothetical protein
MVSGPSSLGDKSLKGIFRLSAPRLDRDKGRSPAVQTDKTVYQERVLVPFSKICKSLFYYSIDLFMLSLSQKSLKNM